MKLMVDYFAGFGGASEAFIKNTNWKVRRFDIYDSGVPELTQIDLLKAPLVGLPFKPELAWFSPPCDEFSRGFNAIGPRTEREGGCFEPNMELAELVIDIINATEPKTWIVENVVGSIKYLEPLFGPPRQIIGPYVLYGNFPKLILPNFWSHPAKTAMGPCELRPRLRAIIPIEISEALLLAMENQRSIFDYGVAE